MHETFPENPDIPALELPAESGTVQYHGMLAKVLGKMGIVTTPGAFMEQETPAKSLE